MKRYIKVFRKLGASTFEFIRHRDTLATLLNDTYNHQAFSERWGSGYRILKTLSTMTSTIYVPQQ